MNFTDVSKKYPKGTIALKNVSFSIGKGIYGLIGPNGAGKTTIIKLILGILAPTSGKILLFGKERTLFDNKIQKKLGFAHAEQEFPKGFTGNEYLDFVSALYSLDIKKAQKHKYNLIEYFQLTDALNKPIENYSSGMKQKLALVQAFLNYNAKLIILDEPTSNLDPLTRIHLFELIKQTHSKEATSFIIASHSLLELEEVCTHYMLLDNGKLIWLDEKSRLKGQRLGDFYIKLIKEGFKNRSSE